MPEFLSDILAPGGAVFFGGAGVSTGSGIPDFRGRGGLEARYGSGSVETLLSATFFNENTEKFYEFYRANLLFPDAKPGKAHIALAQLEKMGCFDAVITQNVDGLHQKAGSEVVFELHGSAEINDCMSCGAVYNAEYVKNYPETIPKCEKCGGMLKPRVVLYEEQLDGRVISGAARAISGARTLIVGGTSLAVYPAAGLLDCFAGERLIIINARPTPFDEIAKRVYRADINELLPLALSRLS